MYIADPKLLSLSEMVLLDIVTFWSAAPTNNIPPPPSSPVMLFAMTLPEIVKEPRGGPWALGAPTANPPPSLAWFPWRMLFVTETDALSSFPSKMNNPPPDPPVTLLKIVFFLKFR